MNKATASLYFDTRKPKKNGECPVKLTIYFEKAKQRYDTGYSLSPEIWNKINKQHIKGDDIKALKTQLHEITKKAQSVIDDIDDFSFEAFKQTFFRTSGKDNLFDLFDDYISSLERQGRISTAVAYGCAKSSLNKYCNKKFKFRDVTVEFLEKYEVWMLNQNISLTTIGMYLRSLRTIINIAIERGYLKVERYPFGKRKYQIPGGRKMKKALTLEDIKKIYYYKTLKGTAEDWAKDLWFFIYFCNGINVSDIAEIKYKNINDGVLCFVRNKTQRSTKSDATTIVCNLNQEAQTTIKKWGNPKAYENYIFPIYKEDFTPQQKYNAVYNTVKTINKYMKRIASEVEIEQKITTYVARHSFATILRQGGVSADYISEALGHKDIRTTNSYLGSFTNETINKNSKILSSFKNS